MGLQGHSWGSFETNYVISRTNLFAAACTASGPSDLISMYGNLFGENSGQNWVQTGQGRMGVSLWQRPDLFIKNSIVFHLDKVQTPLLMMYGKKDQPNYPQGMELFTGLRRLGKKVWMLQYEEEGHGLGGKAANDFQVRMTQFFDHYLKGNSAPKWMVSVIPAKKGVESGYELDTTGRKPGPGLLTDDEYLTPDQSELLKHRTTVNSEGRIVDAIIFKKVETQSPAQ